jgi:hypothetical protein
MVDGFMLAAFPRALGAEARRASEGLAPPRHPAGDRLIQDTSERRWGQVIVGGNELRIPYRHYQDPTSPVADPAAELVRQAWLTRSSHGQVRQQAVQSLLRAPAFWHVPYVLQLCGGYVIEIGQDIAEYTAGPLERDPLMLEAYRRFWRDNPAFVALTYARAASYWDAYYRRTLTLTEYPPHAAVVQVEALVRS